MKFSSFLYGIFFASLLIGITMLLTGARNPISKVVFDEITVGRINIIEPDGTKRIIISNRAQFPGDFEQGKESPRPDRKSYAGILFLDEEENENGGLIQNGNESKNGKIHAGLSLTFDRYRQDQALQLSNDNGENYSAASIKINDVPSYKITSMTELKKFGEESMKLAPVEKEPYWAKLSEEGRLSENRIYMGTTLDKASALILKDAKGRTRMRLIVTADGEGEIQMLDENGKVIKKISAKN